MPPDRVIVVDDSSPRPAEHELGQIAPEYRARVRILHQSNTGPAGARNRALDAVAPDTDLVAFLDSDDVWLPDHLARAAATIRQGFDLYFSNFFHIEGNEGFSGQPLLDPILHRRLQAPPDTCQYAGDVRTAILGKCPIETSTVVIRWDAARTLRFRPEFRDAYEDLLYWFTLASRTSRVAFSTRVECRYGRGVNIFRGGVWGTEGSLKRVVGSTRFKAHVRRSFQLTAEQRGLVRDGLKRNRQAVAAEMLHRLRHLKPMLWSHLLRYFIADPGAALAMPGILLRQVIRKGGYSPSSGPLR